MIAIDPAEHTDEALLGRKLFEPEQVRGTPAIAGSETIEQRIASEPRLQDRRPNMLPPFRSDAEPDSIEYCLSA